MSAVLTASSSFQTIKLSHDEELAHDLRKELTTRRGYQNLSRNNQDKQRELYCSQIEGISSLEAGHHTSSKLKAKSYGERRYANLIS